MVSVPVRRRADVMARRLPVAVACCVVTVLVLGATAVADAPAPKRAGISVVIVGGSRTQRQLARLTALRFGGATIRRVVFQRPSRVLRNEHVRGVELVVSSAGSRTLRAGRRRLPGVPLRLGLGRSGAAGDQPLRKRRKGVTLSESTFAAGPARLDRESDPMEPD